MIPILAIHPQKSVYSYPNRYYMHLVPKNEPDHVIQAFAAPAYARLMMESIAFDSLINLKFVFSREKPAGDLGPHLSFMYTQSFYPRNWNFSLQKIYASQLMHIIDIVSQKHEFLGFTFFSGIELLREAYIEPALTRDGTIRYRLCLGFENSISLSTLNSLESFLKTRFYGFGVFEDITSKIMDTPVPITLTLDSVLGVADGLVANDHEEFKALIESLYPKNKLNKKNTFPIVMHNKGAYSEGRLFVLNVDFKCTREDFIALIINKIYSIIALTILGDAFKFQLRIVFIKPLGRCRYEMSFAFNYPVFTTGMEHLCSLHYAVEVFLRGFGIENYKLTMGASKSSDLKFDGLVSIEQPLKIDKMDYRFEVEKTMYEPLKSKTNNTKGSKCNQAPKFSKRELRAIEARNAKQRRKEQARQNQESKKKGDEKLQLSQVVVDDFTHESVTNEALIAEECVEETNALNILEVVNVSEPVIEHFDVTEKLQSAPLIDCAEKLASEFEQPPSLCSEFVDPSLGRIEVVAKPFLNHRHEILKPRRINRGVLDKYYQ